VGRFAHRALPRFKATAFRPLSASHPCTGGLWCSSFYVGSPYSAPLSLAQTFLQRPASTVTRLVAPLSVRSARCSRRPRETTVTLAIAHHGVSPAPKLKGSAYIQLNKTFGAMCLIQDSTPFNLAELALVQTDYSSSQVLPSDWLSLARGNLLVSLNVAHCQVNQLSMFNW
jgi:hypothetical protein